MCLTPGWASSLSTPANPLLLLPPPAGPHVAAALRCLQAVYLNPRVGAFSTHACVLVGVDGGTREGLVLTPGNYTRLLMFGTLHRHSGFALKIMVGGGTGLCGWMGGWWCGVCVCWGGAGV